MLMELGQRPIGVQMMIKEMKIVLGYSQRFYDGLSNAEVEGMYYDRMRKREMVSIMPRKSKYSQKDVMTAIMLDDFKVRRRAGIM